MKNLFINFEGIDGAGKTTLASLAAKELGYEYLSARPDILSPLLGNIEKTQSPLATYHFFALCNTYRSFEIKEKNKNSGRGFRPLSLFYPCLPSVASGF